MEHIQTPEELFEFMSKNIHYGYLGKNGRVYYDTDPDFDSDWSSQYILESSTDLLNHLYGNCWDQVEFEREWFSKNGYKLETFFEMVMVDYENPFPTHSFLIYKDYDGDWCWFENADVINRGIHRFSSYDELLDYQYNQYKESLKEFNISDDEIGKIMITSFDKPREHVSSKEYIAHAIASRKIR